MFSFRWNEVNWYIYVDSCGCKIKRSEIIEMETSNFLKESYFSAYERNTVMCMCNTYETSCKQYLYSFNVIFVRLASESRFLKTRNWSGNAMLFSRSEKHLKSILHIQIELSFDFPSHETFTIHDWRLLAKINQEKKKRKKK